MKEIKISRYNYQRIPYLDLSQEIEEWEENIQNYLPYNLASKYKVIPISKHGI